MEINDSILGSAKSVINLAVTSTEQFQSYPVNVPTREAIEDKESYRWIEHFNALQDYFSPNPNIELYNICDREGDFYKLFTTRRVLKDEPHLNIHDKVASSPVRTTIKVEIANREICKKRKAIVELKYCKVHFELRFPNPFQKGLQPVTLWVVQLEETNPPKGVKLIKRILLTSKKWQVSRWQKPLPVTMNYGG